MSDRLLTVEQVAEILQTSVDRVYGLHKAGLLKFMKLGRLKVRESTLDAFLERFDGYDVTDPENVKELTA